MIRYNLLVALLVLLCAPCDAASKKSQLVATAHFTTSVAILDMNLQTVSVPAGIAVDRTLGDYPLTIKFKTRDGTATSKGPDASYKKSSGRAKFQPWEETKDLTLLVPLKDGWQFGQFFYLDLMPINAECTATRTIKVFIGSTQFCNGPTSDAGFLATETCQTTSPAAQSTLFVTNGGSNGMVCLIAATRDGTALAHIDYDPSANIVAVEPSGSNQAWLCPLAVLKETAAVGVYYYVDLISTDACCNITPAGTIKVTVCPF